MKPEPEKPPNHERWIISYADFTTLLLATFVVMYAVSSINSSKFQEMSESFSTAFIGRTTHVQDSGFAAANKGPFNFMPSPVHLPVITREQQIKNQPPALRQEETSGNPEEKTDSGKYLPSGGVKTQSQNVAKFQALSQSGTEQPEMAEGPASALRDQVEQHLQGLDAAYEQLAKALQALIGTGEVRVSLQSLGVVIDVNEMLLFNSGKAELTGEALPLIDKIATILKDLHYEIQVNGFTDNVPIHNFQFNSNWDLSATRAISVVKRFVAAGIDPTLLVGAGFGEYHPIAANNTPEGKAANRRVSIVVVSPAEGDDPARTRLLGSKGDRASAAPPTRQVSPPPTAASPPAAAASPAFAPPAW